MKHERSFPTCDRCDCAGYEKGYCNALSDNNFGKRRCPFFKTNEQAEKEKAYREERLANIKREVN